MRGRKPKPTALKRLAGNPGRRPLNESEPQFERSLPYCPRHLNRVAKAEWKRVSRALYEAGLLTKVDRAALAAYCDAYSQWVEATRTVEREGQTVEGPRGGIMKHPCVTIAKESMVLMRAFLVEFGMTPSSRSRIKGAEPPEVGQSLADMLFEGVKPQEPKSQKSKKSQEENPKEKDNDQQS